MMSTHTPTDSEPGSSSTPQADVQALRHIIEEHFPGLWPAVEAGLSVCATLVLADSANPVALIYVGGPSSSKTTVADLFADHPSCYVSDNFTPPSFVSHAANRKTKELDSVDLLPRIKHKVLVTPELAPIFRGKEDELTKSFAIITRVLDGRGLMTDSGTHGRRGHRGDYLFAWLGCTTPFEPKVWRIMAQLGSRLFFLTMTEQPAVTVEQLVGADQGEPYAQRLTACQGPVHGFLSDLFSRHGGVRGVQWDAANDPQHVVKWIARLSMLLAAMRSEPVRETEDSGRIGYTPAKHEQPWRANSVLRNLARGHALVAGRRQLTDDDLPLIALVTVSSMPTDCARVFLALVERGGEPLTVAEAQQALGVRSPETARVVLRALDGRGIVDYREGGQGYVATARFRAEWAWCASPEFRALLNGELVKNRGVCVPPVTPILAQRQWEKEERDTHPPKIDKLGAVAAEAQP